MVIWHRRNKKNWHPKNKNHLGFVYLNVFVSYISAKTNKIYVFFKKPILDAICVNVVHIMTDPLKNVYLDAKNKQKRRISEKHKQLAI